MPLLDDSLDSAASIASTASDLSVVAPFSESHYVFVQKYDDAQVDTELSMLLENMKDLTMETEMRKNESVCHYCRGILAIGPAPITFSNDCVQNSPKKMTRPFSLVSSINKTPANYCLEIAPNASRKAHFATSLSSGSIHLHDVNAFTAYQVIGPQTANSVISHIQFDSSNPHLLWASTRENQVVLHDTRTTSAPVHTYRCPAPVLSFDLNANHSILAAGTELLGDDASILFYDVRASPSEAIATFNECHSDDVTQIQFHPSTPNAMVSGSTDGLVCLYDLTSMNEDDSLYQVIKENSVSKVGFFGPAFEYLYCSTHIETLSLWTFQDAENIVHYGDVRGASPDLSLDYCIDWT
ncbi:WD repeat-containing protein 89, partial [Kappamyces sp. JEL0680]